MSVPRWPPQRVWHDPSGPIPNCHHHSLSDAVQERRRRTLRAALLRDLRRVDNPATASAIEAELRSEPAAPNVGPAPCVIDHTAFPHIIESIMNTSFDALLAFRTTSRAYRDRVDIELATLVVAAPDPSRGKLEIRSPSGVLLGKYGVPPKFLKNSGAVQPSAMKIVRYLCGNMLRPVVHIVGQRCGRPEAVARCLATVLRQGQYPESSAPTTHHLDPQDPNNRRIHASEFKIIPGPDGGISKLRPDWMPPVVTLVDNWRADSCIPLFRKSALGSSVIVYPIDSQAETTRLVSTAAPWGQHVVYDFGNWRPARHRIPEISFDPPTPDGNTGNPRLMNIVQHAARALQNHCTVTVSGIEAVDPGWLDPLYMSGESWSLCPDGSIGDDGRRIPFAAYLLLAINEQVKVFHSDDTDDDADDDLAGNTDEEEEEEEEEEDDDDDDENYDDDDDDEDDEDDEDDDAECPPQREWGLRVLGKGENWRRVWEKKGHLEPGVEHFAWHFIDE